MKPNKETNKEITIQDLQKMTSQELCKTVNDYLIFAKNSKQNYGSAETLQDYGFQNMKWSDIRKLVEGRKDIEKVNDQYMTHTDIANKIGSVSHNPADTTPFSSCSEQEKEALKELLLFISNEQIIKLLHHLNTEPDTLFNNINYVRLLSPQKTINKTYKIDAVISKQLDDFCEEHPLYPKSAVISTGISLVIEALERQDAQLAALFDDLKTK